MVRGGLGWIVVLVFFFKRLGKKGLELEWRSWRKAEMGNGHSGMGMGAVVKWEVVQVGGGKGRYWECVLLNAKSPKN